MRRYNSYTGKSSYTPRSIRRKERKTQKRLIWNIILSVATVYIIFFWGLPNLIGGLSFLNKFKHTNTQTNSGNNITLAPPILNIPYDATNSASINISGYSQPNQKVEIFIDDNLKTTALTGSGGSFQTDPVDLNLGTNNIYGKTLDQNNQESLPSKTIQLTYSNDQPNLDISSPVDNSQIKGGDKKVGVSGKTDPNDNISVNGATVIVSSDGSFSTTIPINDGDNTITIISANSVGNTTTVQRHVNYSSS